MIGGEKCGYKRYFEKNKIIIKVKIIVEKSDVYCLVDWFKYVGV